MTDFNFLVDPPKEPEPLGKVPVYTGPNPNPAEKMTPKKFANSVLDVYNSLGGATWLFSQAVNDPRAFLELLKKLIPKSVQLDDLTGLNISLIDQFGNEVAISTGTQESMPLPATVPDSAAIDSQPGPGQPETATGGNPLPGSVPNKASSEPSQEDSLDIEIREIFE